MGHASIPDARPGKLQIDIKLDLHEVEQMVALLRAAVVNYVGNDASSIGPDLLRLSISSHSQRLEGGRAPLVPSPLLNGWGGPNSSESSLAAQLSGHRIDTTPAASLPDEVAAHTISSAVANATLQEDEAEVPEQSISALDPEVEVPSFRSFSSHSGASLGPAPPSAPGIAPPRAPLAPSSAPAVAALAPRPTSAPQQPQQQPARPPPAMDLTANPLGPQPGSTPPTAAQVASLRPVPVPQPFPQPPPPPRRPTAAAIAARPWPQQQFSHPPPPPPPRAAAAAAPPPQRPAAPGSAQSRIVSAAVSGASSDAMPAWHVCYSSDGADHNKNPVQAISYWPSFEGLPGGDGHGGWLITSSRRLLNLWECSAGGGSKGQPSLQLMHAQETEFLTTRLAVEESLSMLLGASLDVRTGAEALTVHSLSADAGFLAFKYRLGGAADKQRGGAGRPTGMVVSLHGASAALRQCCATGSGGKVLVYETGGLATAAPASAARPRAEWRASDVALTAMARSPALPSCLITGAQDGSVIVWNLKERPGHQQQRVSHGSHVNAVLAVNDQVLASAGQDGKVCLWDLRRGGAPLRVACPDASPALRLALSPLGDSLAVASARGLYCLDLLDSLSCAVSPVGRGPAARPYVDCEWNSRTGEMYACGHDGVITVFTQKM